MLKLCSGQANFPGGTASQFQEHMFDPTSEFYFHPPALNDGKSEGIQAIKNSYWDNLKLIQSQQLPLRKRKKKKKVTRSKDQQCNQHLMGSENVWKSGLHNDTEAKENSVTSEVLEKDLIIKRLWDKALTKHIPQG